VVLKKYFFLNKQKLIIANVEIIEKNLEECWIKVLDGVSITELLIKKDNWDCFYDTLEEAKTDLGLHMHKNKFFPTNCRINEEAKKECIKLAKRKYPEEFL
jgi:hypothetical protein